jgi:hypothetical protein
VRLRRQHPPERILSAWEQRVRYVYDPVTKTMVPGCAPRRVDGPSGDSWRYNDRLYSDNPFRAPDGTVINSRAKHREYMRRNGLTTMDDFKDTWDKAAKERAKFYTPGEAYDSKSRREDLERSIKKLGGDI